MDRIVYRQQNSVEPAPRPHIDMKPRETFRQRLLSRMAMVFVGVFLAVVGTILVAVGIRGALWYVENIAAPGVRLFLVFLIVPRILLYLISASFIYFAFASFEDTRRCPSRGFTMIGAVFDGFGSLVEKILGEA